MPTPKVPAWLHDAVFYQIYPPSFSDSNGDGIGDIPGIIERLDYLASLGVNALWLNPCFVSPFRDGGYDIADYYQVAPRYGANEDLRRLFDEAHARDMRVCLDLVPGHTSVEHPWFQAACDPQVNDFSGRHLWTDSVWTHIPEMNFVLGYAERDANYLANYFYFQPALNYGFGKPDPEHAWQRPIDHPDCLATREAIKQIMRFWLDMGADGFRVDMASHLVKGDPDRAGTIAVWQDFRAMLDREYPEAVIISEWSYPSEALRAGFHVDFMMHIRQPAYTSLFRREKWFDKPGTCYFEQEGGGNIADFLDIYLHHYGETKDRGYISLPSGNHDLYRLSIGRETRDLKVAHAFLLTMPGVPFIYYGDEIGMRYVEGLVSKEGGYFRTGSRTPMQWDDTRNAGFSTASTEQLYLPLDPSEDRPTVADQQQDPDSLLNHIRGLIALRRAHPALGADGEFTPLYAEAHRYPFVYLRTLENERVLVAINPSKDSVNASFPLADVSQVTALLADSAMLTVEDCTGRVTMQGRSYGIFLLQ